ncbi:DUF3168 domain-containing protein [Oricola sp.]|uniref:DUF3168 domain-containing protein n=1 Tax=Oricola sp. TaxID=1979950 RepID=UPI003BAD3776
MSKAAHDLQAAIVSALKNDSALVALLGSDKQIADFVPADFALPIVVIGGVSARDWSTDDVPGCDHQVTIRCWSEGTSRANVLALAERVETALAGLSGIHGTTRLVLLRSTSAQADYVAAELAWRVTSRFRVLSEPAN